MRDASSLVTLHRPSYQGLTLTLILTLTAGGSFEMLRSVSTALDLCCALLQSSRAAPAACSTRDVAFHSEALILAVR